MLFVFTKPNQIILKLKTQDTIFQVFKNQMKINYETNKFSQFKMILFPGINFTLN